MGFLGRRMNLGAMSGVAGGAGKDPRDYTAATPTSLFPSYAWRLQRERPWRSDRLERTRPSTEPEPRAAPQLPEGSSRCWATAETWGYADVFDIARMQRS